MAEVEEVEAFETAWFDTGIRDKGVSAALFDDLPADASISSSKLIRSIPRTRSYGVLESKTREKEGSKSRVSERKASIKTTKITHTYI